MSLTDNEASVLSSSSFSASRNHPFIGAKLRFRKIAFVRITANKIHSLSASLPPLCSFLAPARRYRPSSRRATSEGPVGKGSSRGSGGTASGIANFPHSAHAASAARSSKALPPSTSSAASTAGQQAAMEREAVQSSTLSAWISPPLARFNSARWGGWLANGTSVRCCPC